MATPELFRALLSHATSSGSRSTALQPLVLLTGLLISGFVLIAPQIVPQWTLILLAVLLGLCVCIFLIVYLVFACKNPDALRSEKFNISKMAIEKNLIGDNKVGLVELDEYDKVPTLPTSPVLPNKKGGVK
jgi:c-di-AMP phosphodiesterase-like protein